MKGSSIILGVLSPASVVAISLSANKITAQRDPKLPDQEPVEVIKDRPLKPFTPANVIATPLDQWDFEKLSRTRSEVLDRFGKQDPTTHQATFDAKAAKEAGYDQEIIKLAQESVDSENELISDLRTGKASMMGGKKPDPVKYPRLRKFQDRATERIHKMKKEGTLQSEEKKNTSN